MGTAALFNNPTGVALSADASSLLVADKNNNKVRIITLATGEVRTLAGGGATGALAGSALANGIGSNALFGSNGVWNLAFSPAFTLVLVVDGANHAVRAITKNGVVSTLAGGGATGSASGLVDGVGTSALLLNPRAVAVDPVSGLAYLMENTRLRSITPDGTTRTMAGGGAGDGIGSNANLNNCCSNGPTVCCSMALGPDGNLYAHNAYYGGTRKIVPTAVFNASLNAYFASVTTITTSPAQVTATGVAISASGIMYNAEGYD
jgi:hypothetical protein